VAEPEATTGRDNAFDHVDPTLVAHLREMADRWGALGVAVVAAQLSSPTAVIQRLTVHSRIASATPNAGRPIVRSGLGEGWPQVAGRCPACGRSSLFLGSGGHVTCATRDCADSCAVDDRLHGPLPAATTDRHAVIDAGYLAHQRDWSAATFGPGFRLGTLDHLAKELEEVRADPLDLGEWVDLVILAFDGAWRAGHSPQQIINAIVAKQARNEARTWPDWRTAPSDRAIEHDRSAPEPKPFVGDPMFGDQHGSGEPA